ncbi:MAG: hypothetical protein ACYDCC_09775 [Actinomycetota bacterium]
MKRSRIFPAVLAGVLLTGYLIGTTVHSAVADLGADKVGVSASTLERMATQTNQGSTSSTVTLLTGTMRLSNEIDLLMNFSAECALFTDVKTINTGDSSDTSQAIATVQAWVTIDGNPVPVTQNDGTGKPDDGKVVFCNRDHKLNTVFKDDSSDDSIMIADYIHSREANDFNWAALNVPAGIHTIEVKAVLTANVTTPNGMAEALVGKRTLFVTPVHLGPDATF